MTDEYQDILLQFSDDEEKPTTKPQKKGKYTMSEKAKLTRSENLRKGREKRQAMLKEKLKMQKHEKEVDSYSESDSEESDYRSKKRPHKPKVGKARRDVSPVKHNKKEEYLLKKLQQMENQMEQLTKKTKRTVHKTVIVPPVQQQQQPIQQAPPIDPNREMIKKKIFDLC
jgi:hypothetical protein